MVDDLKEMQYEELQAIQAIYMDDYVNQTQDGHPPEIILHLTPLQSVTGKEVHAKVDFHVKYTSSYPNDPPILKLENAKGMPNDQLTKLKTDLDKMASELCGEVMVLQLAQYIQSILHQYNVPNLSFFEQMLANRQKEEEKLIQEELLKQEAKVAEVRERDEDVMRQVKEELIKREEVLKKEKRKRQTSNSFNSLSDSAISLTNLSTSLNEHKPVFVCLLLKDRKLSVYTFRHKQEEKKVFCSSCTGHYFENACLLSAIEESTGKQMSLCEWKIKIPGEKRTVRFTELDDTSEKSETIAKQVQSIEQEFTYLKSKISYPGILNYHAMNIEQNGHQICAKLLLDPITGPPLSSFLDNNKVSMSFLQHISKQLVNILQYLHGKSVVHRDLNLHNTFVNTNNEIIVGGYAIMRRISDICLQFNTDFPTNGEERFQGYRKLVKCGKRGDVFNLGLLLLCLHQGRLSTEYPVVIPKDVPEHFKDFVKSCLDSDEEKRGSINQLSKHPFLHEKIQILQQSSTSSDVSLGIQHKQSVQQQVPLRMALLSDSSVLAKSRLTSEFHVETMEMLGKGGFGSVIKVTIFRDEPLPVAYPEIQKLFGRPFLACDEIRNKLDGNWYAIKRIPLNPKCSHLNKRIIREVKLLSRLNHENVVRYFNSWIEAEDINITGATTSEENEFTSTSPNKNKQKQKRHQSQVIKQQLKRNVEESLLELNNFDDNIAAVDGDSGDVSWGDEPSKRTTTSVSLSSSSSSSSSSTDEQQQRSNSRFGNRSYSRRSVRTTHDSSEGIVFQMDDSMLQFGDMLDSEDSDDDISHGDGATNTATTSTESSVDVPLQYLYIQMEYCERNTLRNVIDDGLYKDEECVWRYFREIVEGLAHVHGQGIIHRDLKPFNIFMDSFNRIKIGDFGLATSHGNALDSTVLLKDSEALQSSTMTDENMTGKVGTALYVAPELCTGNNRIKFSQKVDMYSLGIILFEMCYRPLDTGMERVKTLGLLRTIDKIFPEDFNTKKNSRDQFVISWLLNHDPDARPTATELLESGYVPPKIEDSQLDELLRHTLSQTNSSRYQRLMTTLFVQPVTPVYDQIYDSDMQDKSELQIVDAARTLQYVRHVITKIFLKHGAVFVEVPLLMPKMKIFDKLPYVASFIDQSGLQLCLPYDSRISFARYVSRNKIVNLKRFYFGKLFRSAKVLAAHPISLWECSYDIITGAYNSMLTIAELMYTVAEIMKEFQALSTKNFYIRLNHLNLLKAIFVQHNFTEEHENQVYEILETTRNVQHREELLTGLFAEFKLAEHVINKLVTFLTFEGSITKAKETLQVLRKSKAPVSSLAKQAFHEIDRLLKHLENFDVHFPILISTFYVANTRHYSGIVFQFVAENTRKRKRGGVDILAAGGCYNKLVEEMNRYAETSNVTTSVGVSIAVEKLLLAAVEEKELSEHLPQHLSECDVIVCSVTNTPNLDVLVQVLHELWSANIYATLFSYEASQDYTVEEIQDYCLDHGINHLVVLKETDVEYIRVRSRDKDKFVECRILRQDLCDYLNHKIASKHDKDVEQTVNKSVPPTIFPNNEPSFMFTFVSIQKIDANKKRLFSKLFVGKYQHQLQQMFGGNDIQIVAAKLEKSELKVIGAYLELNGSYDDFETSLRSIVDMYKEQGTFFKRICNTLYQVYSDSHAVVLLYSYVAEIYKVVA